MKSLASALFSVLLSAPTMAYELSGEWIEGGLLFGQADPGSQVQFKGEPVMVSDQGVFVIGLHRDEDDPVTLSVTEPDGTVDRQTFDVIQRDYLIQRVEGIARTIMEPSEADQNKIWADVLETREARAVRGDNLDFLADFTWPVRGPISGVYGSQRFYNGTPGNPHYGLDIAVPTGTPIVAPAAGVVTLANADMFYSGGTVVLDHGHGVSSSFLHMSKLSVSVGDRLQQGDLIGEVGATGRVTGPHLDWRMNWGDARVDPEFLLRASGAWQEEQPE